MSLSRVVTQSRELGIGGSDAMRIMKGDWVSLFLEKTGRKMPVNLDDNFSVQLGKHTESFHGDWFAKMTGWKVVEPEPFYVSSEHPHMFCHLDRWIRDRDTFVELKHSNERSSAVEAAKYYLPQLTHCSIVVGVSECWISVILGNREPDYQHVTIGEAYRKELIETVAAFWWHVENDEEPMNPPVAKLEKIEKAAIDSVLIGGLRSYDMSRSNVWADLASAWLATRDAAETNVQASKGLKELMPEDGRDAFGHGVVIRRDRAGRLALRVKED